MTPDDLRALAARANQLATDITAAQAELRRAADRPTQGIGWRLDEAAGEVRAAAGEITDTATDLQTLQDRDGSMCPVEWGCCPNHGGTLAGSGGKSWCTTPGCWNTWDHDRLGMPCTEPATMEAKGDEETIWGRVCVGHAITAGQSGLTVRWAA